MACISYNRLWESEFDNLVSEKDKIQDMNYNHLKLKVHDSYKKDEKLSTKKEPSNVEDVIKNDF